jgi:hypothetical protein
MAQSNSILWREQRLESGSWAHGLSWLLAPKRLIKGWHPKIRAERASKRRYIQYEPVNWSGPFVFAGRPAIKAVPERDSTPERLVVGYLVERGHPIGTTAEDDLVMDSKWHWKGFESALSDSRIRSRLDHLVLMFDGNRRMARIVISGVPETDLAIPYVGGTSLRAIETVVATADPQEVISVMLGVSFTLEECLRFSQADILNEFSPALVIAADIAEMIENAVQ